MQMDCKHISIQRQLTCGNAIQRKPATNSRPATRTALGFTQYRFGAVVLTCTQTDRGFCVIATNAAHGKALRS